MRVVSLADSRLGLPAGASAALKDWLLREALDSLRHLRESEDLVTFGGKLLDDPSLEPLPAESQAPNGYVRIPRPRAKARRKGGRR